MKRRKRAYSPGWAPANAVAWCDFHDRGCNDAYIRRKHCLTKQRGRPCRHLRILPPAGGMNTVQQTGREEVDCGGKH